MADEFDSEFKLVSSYLFGPLLLAVLRLLIAVFTFVTLIFSLVWGSVRTHDAKSYVAEKIDSNIDLEWDILASFRTLQTSLSLGYARILSRPVCRQFHTTSKSRRATTNIGCKDGHPYFSISILCC